MPEDQSSSHFSENPIGSLVTIEERSTPWKERGEKPNWKIYSVDIQTSSGKVDFADIFTDEDGVSFIWPGIIDFAQLEETALGKIPSLLTADQQILHTDDTSTQKATKVIFSTVWENDPFREYSLSNKRHLQRYRNMLSKPGKITFARYDIDSPNLSYSFTADNVTASEHARQHPELAVRVPYGRELSESLIEWAASTHKDTATFTLDRQTLAEVTKRVNNTVDSDRQAQQA
jgi:hypothetical protein